MIAQQKCLPSSQGDRRHESCFPWLHSKGTHNSALYTLIIISTPNSSNVERHRPRWFPVRCTFRERSLITLTHIQRLQIRRMSESTIRSLRIGQIMEGNQRLCGQNAAACFHLVPFPLGHNIHLCMNLLVLSFF